MAVVTDESVRAMQPGRDLDALVAERVMGFVADPKKEGRPHPGMPDYSTDIADAVKVIEQLRQRFWTKVLFGLNWNQQHGGLRAPSCSVEMGEYGDPDVDPDLMLRAVEAPTVPHAICLVALLTTMEPAACPSA